MQGNRRVVYTLEIDERLQTYKAAVACGNTTHILDAEKSLIDAAGVRWAAGTAQETAEIIEMIRRVVEEGKKA